MVLRRSVKENISHPYGCHEFTSCNCLQKQDDIETFMSCFSDIHHTWKENCGATSEFVPSYRFMTRKKKEQVTKYIQLMPSEEQTCSFISPVLCGVYMTVLFLENIPVKRGGLVCPVLAIIKHSIPHLISSNLGVICCIGLPWVSCE